MTLLYFADTRFPIERANGVQTMATCHGLAARGHDVTLVVRQVAGLTASLDPFAFYGRATLPNLRIERVGTAAASRARRVAFLLASIRRAVTTRGAIVYTRDLGLAAVLVQIPAWRRPKIVYESHGISPVVAEEMPRLLGDPALTPSPSKLRRLDRQEQRVWKRADGYVTITAALRDDLSRRYGPRENVHVVPDGADSAHANESRPKPNGRAGDGDGAATPGLALAAYAGHLYPWKGVDVFVRALAMTSHVRGLIVGGHPGEADLGRVQALAAELRIFDRFSITGLVAPANVRARLADAEILVLPNTASVISERYTSPLKLFEYLALGRPIIASDLPSIREVLTDGESALLVTPGDPQALATALDRIATDPALAASLGAAARSLAPQYTWERRAERLEAVLSAVSA